MVMPVYVSEMSPKEHRGKLSAVVGPLFSGSVLAILCFNVGFAKFRDGWRLVHVIVTVLGVIYTIGMLFQPHTPR